MLVENNAIFSVSSMLSSIGIIGRKAIIPLHLQLALAKEPTGSLMAALQAMRSPKGCRDSGLGSFYDFSPTISGEYRAIRSSQRFPGELG